MSEKHIAEELKSNLYEQNVKLCRAVQMQRCVYDRENPCQKKECFDKAWEAIAKECDDTVKSCKFRWRNIRFSFMRSLQPNSKKRQSNRCRDYYLYEDLIFLIPHISAASDFNKIIDSDDDDVSLVAEKSSEKSKLDATPKSKKKKIAKENEDELTTSADETATDEQKSPQANNKTKANKSPIQVKSSKVGTFIIPKTVEDGTKKQNASEDFLSATPPAAAARKDTDKRDFRFRRACKRSLDKNVVQQLRDISPKKDVEPKKARRSTMGRRSLTKIEKNSEDKVELPRKEVETPPKKQKEKKFILPKSTEKTRAEKSLSSTLEIPELPVLQNQKFDYDLPESIEPTKLATTTKCAEPLAATCEQASQCNTVTDTWDDEFLNTLRPQMAVMNLRQKLNFKQKVYLSLMEVFDNPANFPGPDEKRSVMPPLMGNAATTAEMSLIRELVSMVQAAKLSPELKAQPTIEELTENSQSAKSNDTIEASTSAAAQAEAAQKRSTWRFAEAATRPHLVRKIYKTNADGTFTTQDGAKPRIFRILPKAPSSGTTKQKTLNSNVGTFIIPRAPASIASSVNAAAAAAEAAEKCRASPNTVYRQIPVSGGSVLVSSAQAIAVGNSAPGMHRTMTIHSTVRPGTGTGTSPRQIMRRYSICGTSGNIADVVDSAKKINPTIAGVAPHLDLRHSTVYSTMATRNRLIGTTTATPPFKLPSSPAGATSVTQSLKTRTTPTPAKASSNISPFTLSTAPVKVPIGTLGALQNFSLSNANTSPTNVLSAKNNSSTISQNTTKETEKSSRSGSSQPRNRPSFNEADTAGIIASDNFTPLNIKNEPMD